MAVIPGEIAEQAFEMVRDRLAAILADELAAQYAISTASNKDVLLAAVYTERVVPFDKTELPCINVQLASGEYSGQTMQQADGSYQFIIDCYASAKNTDGTTGDVLAMVKLQKLMGVIRAILQDSRYKTLGYATPFIKRRQVAAIAINNNPQQDATHTVMGRVTVNVEVPEFIDLIEPDLMAGNDTTVLMSDTDKGYLWISIGNTTNYSKLATVLFNLVGAAYTITVTGDYVITDGSTKLYLQVQVGGDWFTLDIDPDDFISIPDAAQNFFNVTTIAYDVMAAPFAGFGAYNFRMITEGDTATSNIAIASVGVVGDDATAVLKNTIDEVLSETSIPSGGSADITAPNATAALKNTSGTLLSTTDIPAGTSEDITAPDAEAVVKDTLGNIVVSTTSIPSQVSQDIVAPDGTAYVRNSEGDFITAKNIPSGAINPIAENAIVVPDTPANAVNSLSDVIGSANLPSVSGGNVSVADVNNVDSDGSTAPTPAGVPFVCTPQVKALFSKFTWQSGNDTTSTVTIDSDSAGTYTSTSNDGASGTITLSINGGAYAAFSNPLALAVNDTIALKRTTITALGWAKISGTYV